MSVVLLDLGVTMPDPLGPPPANLKSIMATQQNTITLQDGEPVVIRPPRVAGGPDVWTWQLLNVGPGICYARWDGLGYAASQDEHSLYIPPGVGFSGMRARVITLACNGATFVALSAENLPGG